MQEVRGCTPLPVCGRGRIALAIRVRGPRHESERPRYSRTLRLVKPPPHPDPLPTRGEGEEAPSCIAKAQHHYALAVRFTSCGGCGHCAHRIAIGSGWAETSCTTSTSFTNIS